VQITRRVFVEGLAATSILPSLISSSAAEASDEILQYVDPMIGTGGEGHCFPAATVPFGAVQLGPDTGDYDWDHCSGYHYKDGAILGFSHTHLSGTGGGDMRDFRFMPAYSDAVDPANPREFAAQFSHTDEAAEAGYYKVMLRKPNVLVELTATERCGIHRYRFARQGACLLVDLSNVWRTENPTPNEPSLMNWAHLEVQGNGFFASRSTEMWAKGREIYARTEFSHPPVGVELFVDGQKMPIGAMSAKGKIVHAVFHFSDLPGGVLVAKTGISGVDRDGAKRNLMQEASALSFDSARSAARQTWAKALGRVRILEGGERRERRIFYTGLYHAMLAPTIFDDADKRYRGMDGKVHTLALGERNYSTFSAWDTYRGLHPMYTIMLPELVPAICNCIIRQSLESPEGPTVWPLQGKETGCMDGYHSVSIVAEALVKKFPGIHPQDAYRAYRKRAEVDNYRGLGEYRQYGYLPCDRIEQSASRTCNYAYDDYCVAALAEKAGDHEEAARLRTRSLSYRNVYEKESGFIRPRLADGSWAAPFNPKAITITHRWRDYEEANGWQTTFLAQHDPAGLRDLLGGNKALEKKLDALFDASSDMPTEMMPPDITGLIGQYCHGNEPSHHIVFLYNTAGVPHKAQARIRQILTELYHDAPDAMAGNDDCGQMSAWFCLNALGLYPINPVSGSYDVGTPLFDKVVVQLGGARTLTVVARRQSKGSIYVSSVSLNGKPVVDWSIAHADLARGGTLEFTLKDSADSVAS
jgi:predicted alpha-1,2-mannosidase